LTNWKSKMYILELPLELIVKIFLYCPEYLIFLRFVCSTFFNAAKIIGYKDSNTIKILACKGELRLLKKLKKQGYVFKEKILLAAAEGGNLKTVEFLSKNQELNEWVSVFAAKGGQIEILDWLKNKTKISEYYCYHAATLYGHLEVLKWLEEQNDIVQPLKKKSNETFLNVSYSDFCDILNNACKSRNCEVITFILSIQSSFLKNCPVALSLLIEDKELFKNMCKFIDKKNINRAYSYFAAKNGELRILNKLKEENTIFFDEVVNGFGINGHINVLKWLEEDGCDTAKIIKIAAKYGHVHVLEYLQGRNLYFLPALKSALEYKQFEVVKFLLERNVTINKIPSQTFNERKRTEEYFCPIRYYNQRKKIRKRINECVQLLIRSGYTVRYKDCLNAFIYRNISLTKSMLLLANDADSLVDNIQTFSNEIIEFLIVNRNYKFSDYVGSFFLALYFKDLRLVQTLISALFKKGFNKMSRFFSIFWLQIFKLNYT
jgi:hypothetical protein